MSAQTRFPLCDAHGNSVGTLGRSGSSWTLGDERSYDAWGRVRQGGQTGAPSARYCASLGHVQDDESGLVYMRARYYEAGTGRFVSEDPARDGINFYSYCRNDPVNMVDESGKSAETCFQWSIVGCGFLMFAMFALIASESPQGLAASIFLATMSVAAFGAALNECTSVSQVYGSQGSNILSMLTAADTALIAFLMVTTKAGLRTQAAVAVVAAAGYALVLMGALAAQRADEESSG